VGRSEWEGAVGGGGGGGGVQLISVDTHELHFLPPNEQVCNVSCVVRDVVYVMLMCDVWYVT